MRRHLLYGAASSVRLDQSFPYVYIHKLFLNCAESQKSAFWRCLYVTKSQGSDLKPHRMYGAWSESGLFAPLSGRFSQMTSQIRNIINHWTQIMFRNVLTLTCFAYLVFTIMATTNGSHLMFSEWHLMFSNHIQCFPKFTDLAQSLSNPIRDTIPKWFVGWY